MSQEQFFIEKLVEIKPILSTAAKIPTPLGRILTGFCNASTPGDARKGIEDFFKISTQLTLLILISVIRQSGAELPRNLQKTIRDKWLQGSHDLTEGERLFFIKEILQEMHSTLSASKIGSTFVETYSDQSYDDLDTLLKFKIAESHKHSGDEEWSKRVVEESLPSFKSLVARWDRLAHLEFLLVRDSVGWVLSGPDKAVRCVPGEISPGLYLRETHSGERVSMQPFVLADGDFSLQVFCGANGRKPTAARFASLGPEAIVTEGTMDALEALGALLPKEEMSPLFGMERNLQKISTVLKDWSHGKSKPALLFVTGEEGTGKTSLIDRALSALQPQPRFIRVSGGSNQGDLKLFCLEILAGLFGLDPDYDVRIIEQLNKLGRETGGSRAAQILSGFLTEHTDIQGRASAQVHTATAKEVQEKKWSDNRMLEEITEHGHDLQANKIYQALFSVIRAWASQHGRKVIIWMQDAQLYERQPDLAVDVFLNLQERQANADVLVVAEFRAERTRDAKRIRERYITSSCSNIETQELDKKGVGQLIACWLEIQPNLLSEQVGEDIYKSSGGNPKWVLDVLRILEDRGEIRKKQSPTELSLILPKLFRAVIPRELKDIAKSRVLDLNLTKTELDVLSVLSLCPSRTIPVSFVAKILGVECQQSIRRFEKVGLLTDDDAHEEWSVTFEHLAERQACKEIIEGRDETELNDLAERSLAALKNESTQVKNKDFSRLFSLIRDLAKLTKNPEALGLTVAELLQDADINDLRTWFQILKKTVSPSSFLAAVRDYAALRLAELEAQDVGSDIYERLISTSNHFLEQNDPVKTRLFVELMASIFASLTRMFSSRRDATTLAMLNFVEQLTRHSVPHISQERLIGSFSTTFWENVGAKASSVEKNELWSSINSRLDSIDLSPLFRFIFVAVGKIYLNLSGSRQFGEFYPSLKLGDAIAMIDSSLDELSAATPGQVSQDRIPMVIKLIISDLMRWVLFTDQEALGTHKDELYSLLNRLEVHGDKRNVDNVRCKLSSRIADSLANSVELEKTIGYWQFLEELKKWPLARLVALASSLVHRHEQGLSIDAIATPFIELLDIEPNFNDLPTEGLKSISMALNVIGTETAFSKGRMLLKQCIENGVKEEEDLDDILTLISDQASVLQMDAKEQFDNLSKLKKWKKEESTLIKLYRSEADRLSDESGSKDKWQKHFDAAKVEFVSPQNPNPGEAVFRNVPS